ncbi:MAG: tRNA dihydrouridine synthase DusB [Gammaproteobacteria bacterium]|nr:tRNA dihydrouridine synthase DusB [Gammaproteobacteria bacterium]
MQIGRYKLDNNLVLAPMAGVTDTPFRQLCKKLGAGMAVSEMVTANSQLWNSKKTRLRINHHGETEPRVVQIAGAEPDMMAEAAQYNVARGAQMIDINMGCPAKKVCNKLAGSALLRDEKLVARILNKVVNAVDVPVTLKIRTGWDPAHRNGKRIAKLAEDTGIQALAVHGRTRSCGFRGHAEYDTIKTIAAAVRIPVLANGDINNPLEAERVLDHTGAAGIMIGRAAQGRPWIFREIAHYFETGEILPEPGLAEKEMVLTDHLRNLYRFYGEFTGVRVARKHIGWYCKSHPGAEVFRKQIVKAESAREQLALIRKMFICLAETEELAA